MKGAQAGQPVAASWMAHWIMAAGSGWGAWALWKYSQNEDAMLTLFVYVLAAISVSRAFKGWAALDDARERKTLHFIAMNHKSIVHGQARFANKKDIKRAGLYKRKGIFIGRVFGRDLWYPHSGHALTIAPPRSGKGTGICVPNLLLSPDPMIVLDVKAELYAITHKWRRRAFNHEIKVISPWSSQLSEELEMAIPDHGGDLIGPLLSGGDPVRIKENADLISILLIAGSPKETGSERYWTHSGRELVAAVLLYMVATNRTITLPALRTELMRAGEQWLGLFRDMMSIGAFDGTVSEVGKRLTGLFGKSDAEFSGVVSTAQLALKEFAAGGALGQHSSRESSLDFSTVKRGQTIYICIPSDRLAANASFLSLVLGLAFETVGKDRTSTRVRFQLDEIFSTGIYLPVVLRSMAQYMGQGVQVHNIAQSTNQIAQIYGTHGLSEFLDMSGCINTFSMWNPKSAEIFSKMAGQETVQDASFSGDPMRMVGDGLSASVSARARTLMSIDALRTMPKGKQLVMLENNPAIVADKISYLDDPRMRRMASENPYFRRRKRRFWKR